ncbi:MAG TPA: potassium channel protein [Thermoplasmata archaeon]|nr:potassium channel protein [Thermoplasmata archaeon]
MAHPRRRYFVDLARRVVPFLLVYAGVFLGAGFGFFLLEGSRYSLFDSMYWSIVTLGTVGYGDIVPTTGPSKVLASVVIATQVFLLGYLFTVITSAVAAESERRSLGTYGTDMGGHVVVLGYSAVGRAAVRELLIQDQRVAVVVEDSEAVANVRSLGPPDRLFVTYGDPAERDILERLNLPAAHGVIVCTDDDATNMIGALNVRALSTRARVVVSVARPELRETLRAAGVTYVASPADLGGRLCASAAFEPDVATAIEAITAADFWGDMQEYVIGPSTVVGPVAFGEAEGRVRAETGCLLIGYARADAHGEFRPYLTPPPETRLAAGDAILILGAVENTRRFRRWFGAEQGR